MTPDQQALVERLAKERNALREALRKLPFDYSTAGATRIAAFKAAHAEGQRVLNSNTMDPSRYVEARLRLVNTGSAPVDQLAKDIYDR